MVPPLLPLRASMSTELLRTAARCQIEATESTDLSCRRLGAPSDRVRGIMSSFGLLCCLPRSRAAGVGAAGVGGVAGSTSCSVNVAVARLPSSTSSLLPSHSSMRLELTRGLDEDEEAVSIAKDFKVTL